MSINKLFLVGLPMALSLSAFGASPQEVPNTDQQLTKCGMINNDSARLVCYDELLGGNTPATLSQKRPVVLADTIKSTVTGNPQVVFLDEPTTTPPKLTSTTSPPKQVRSESTDSKILKRHLTSLFGKEREVKKGDLVESKDRLTNAAQTEAVDKYTPLSLAFDLDKNSERGLWSARPHNANYILPFYYNGQPNRNPTTPTLGGQTFTKDELRDIELKFQLSLKTKAMQNLFGTDADLWIGYTQLSHWQTYNENHSRPFRAHDYEPELFLTQPVTADLPLKGKLRMLGVGAVHHSNGESDPLSRSWNRLYVMGGAEWGNLTVMPRIWTQLKKKEGSKPSDNPDITDYYGFGDVKFLYRLDDGKNISGMVRYNPKTGKGGIQLDYVHPLGRGVSGYAQIFQGYGQSLVDYNHEATSFGVGIMLNDWMGL